MKIRQLQSTFLLLFIVSILIFPVSVSAETKAGLTPSSPFYFLDITFEKIGLFFTLNTEKRIEKYLKYSEERLAEAEEVANENKPELVEKAIKNYEKNISLATEESRTIEDKTRAEELLNEISENTSKHQAI